MLLAIGAVIPAILSIIGFMLLFGKHTAMLGGLMLFGAGLLGSFEAAVVVMMTPNLAKILEAKLKKKDLLLVWLENGKLIPLPGKFESGWIWLRDKFGYLISTDNDRAYLDGIPTFLVYRPVGRTLNPRVLADIALLEKYGVNYEDVVSAFKRLGTFPTYDIDDEGNLIEVIQEVKSVEEDKHAGGVQNIETGSGQRD